jgi:NADPH-dependent 2,4-dienoyl-CoA reductase/sulfur reductase-like enzyme
MTADELQERRRVVEQARADLARSVDELSGKALDTPNQLVTKLRENAVPIAAGVAGLLVVAALRRRGRRRRNRPLIEAGPFVLLERR